MRYCRLFILLIVFSVGCSSCVMRPKNVLSKHKMENVLYDLHKTDGIVVLKGLSFNHDEQLAAIYQTTLEKHGVTQAQFDSSLVWYTDNPKRFNKIYPAVIKRLQADIDSLEPLTSNTNKTVSPKDIPPYNLDSLMEVFVEGLPIKYYVKAVEPLQEDTDLYYIFPLETIDSISLAIHSMQKDSIN